VRRDLVFEIGTEEIPAGYIPPAVKQLRELCESFLAASRIEAAGGVRVEATPRRLVLFAGSLPERQEDRTEEVTGPPWRAAFAEDGTPTKAAVGFARGRGLEVAELRRIETARGPYAGATLTIEGRPTLDLLAAALPSVTQELTFPKTMRWGPSRFRFPRPIRWILALFGDDVIPMEIEGVRSGRLTYGHRILAKGPFEVASASRYESALAKGKVVLSARERAEKILEALSSAAAGAGGALVPDPELVEEVSYLVETPSAFSGEFDEEFLELPEPVIVTAMRDHQRYFAVRGAGGKLLPRFLSVANSSPESEPAVRNGNQRVLRARLADARFYWNEDLKTKLEDKVPRLAAVVWLEGFGSLRDKSDRVAKLAAHLAARFPEPTRRTVARAALLAKTDLVTEMIKDGKEFTGLVGVIGKEYALRNGEPAEVAAAIEEQYRPRFAGDELPGTDAGACLAISDKIDTLAGVWAAGLKPTGSKDPFALRRGALGIVRILLARGMDLSIEELLAIAVEPFRGRLANAGEVIRETAGFVSDRLAGHLVEEEGFESDVVAAVLAGGTTNPLDARARVSALSALRSARRADFEALAAGFKRAKNILKQAQAPGSPSADHLVENAERSLFEAFRAVDEQVASAEREHRYEEALAGLARLRGPIDSFFDEVLVMAEDRRVRENRLRLLGRIVDRVQDLADLSRIALPEEKGG
jgi:glycyl-tRNA synthetase beta chain